MRKLLSVLLCLFLCTCLSSCASNDHNSSSVDDYEDGYNYGYDSGYEQGLWDGAFECKKDFANAIRDKYFEVEGATSNGRDLHPEEAIMVLNDYLDGEYVSDAELESAIESISDFYYDWQSVIADIEDFDVDVDFN